MRRSMLIAALLLTGAGGAGAQPRLTIAPTVTRIDPGSIYEHNTTFAFGGFATETRTALSLDASYAIGGMLALRVLPSWSIWSEVATSKPRYEYAWRQSAGGLTAEEMRWSKATLTTVGFGVLHTRRPFERGPDVEIGAGGVLQWFDLSAPKTPCAPPSAGLPPCTREPWMHRYSAPGLSGRLSLHQALAPRLGVRLGASYTAARANTENMWADLVPELDAFEPPKSYGVNVVSITAGVVMGLW